jgi:hypothetical protein
MYTKYLYPVEIAAVILLVAMIAAIALTLAYPQGQQGHQSVAAGACACRGPSDGRQDGCHTPGSDT